MTYNIILPQQTHPEPLSACISSYHWSPMYTVREISQDFTHLTPVKNTLNERSVWAGHTVMEHLETAALTDWFVL